LVFLASWVDPISPPPLMASTISRFACCVAPHLLKRKGHRHSAGILACGPYHATPGGKCKRRSDCARVVGGWLRKHLQNVVHGVPANPSPWGCSPLNAWAELRNHIVVLPISCTILHLGFYADRSILRHLIHIKGRELLHPHLSPSFVEGVLINTALHALGVRVTLQNLAYPLVAGSVKHFSVLSSDNTFRLYCLDNLTIAEQSFTLHLRRSRYNGPPPPPAPSPVPFCLVRSHLLVMPPPFPRCREGGEGAGGGGSHTSQLPIPLTPSLNFRTHRGRVCLACVLCKKSYESLGKRSPGIAVGSKSGIASKYEAQRFAGRHPQFSNPQGLVQGGGVLCGGGVGAGCRFCLQPGIPLATLHSENTPPPLVPFFQPLPG